MNKLFKSFVIILTMLFLLSPICFGATPELKKQIKKEDGSLFEKIIEKNSFVYDLCNDVIYGRGM